MNEISSDTMELVEAAVPAAEFTDELSDEALDRPQAQGARQAEGAMCGCAGNAC